MNGSQVACMCVYLSYYLCVIPSLLLCSLEPKKKNSLTTSKTSPNMTCLHVYNNTETLVSCLGHQCPSAVSLWDTKNYTV